jgi:hypothetical protein
MYDAQKAYEKLEEHHLTSNTAMFAANKIMEYLTTISINDGMWHSTLENFLINWQEQFRRYEHLVPAASHYKDKQKLVMLQVTVHHLREIRQVKNTALLIKQANSGKDLTYDKYVQLLTHAASDYNNVQIKAKGKRQVYIHNINDNTFDTYNDATSAYEPFDINTPVDTIEAYALNYHPTSNRSDNNNRVQMTKDRWISLDDKTKAIGIA